MFCIFTKDSLFVLELVILCLGYFVFVTVYLSAPVQAIAWKDSSLCRVRRLNPIPTLYSESCLV